MTDDTLNQTRQAYAQAKKYGEELAHLYAAEKTRRMELETTAKKLQAIFDTAPNALAVVDSALTIVEANPRFLFLFEQADGCLGKPLADVLPGEALLETIQTMQAQMSGLGGVEIEMTVPFPRTLLVALAPLGNGQGWVLIVHDLTERKRLEVLKEEFINIAAHELRTPLAGIIGFASVLREDIEAVDDPMLTEVTGLVVKSAERLKRIIDELVGAVVARSGASHSLHIANIDMEQLLQNTIALLQRQIEHKGVTYHLDLPAEPLTLQGDRFILSEVIYQLLKNAVIFNKPEGTITVRSRRLRRTELTEIEKEALEEDDAGEIILIEIKDTGIGIPQTDLDKVFDKFYQVQEHLTRSVEGLGMGLAIARQGVEQHGGQLTVTSNLGQGSTFRVMLPPTTQLKDISADNRLDRAHQQTLTYANEMARAVASQRKMSRKMAQIKTLSAGLAETFNQLLAVEPGSQARADVLTQAQKIIQALVELSEQTMPESFIPIAKTSADE